MVSLAQERVDRYSPHYIVFGIFGIVNFPIAYLYELIVMHTSEGLIIRSLATILCVGLLMKNQWPEKYKKYLGIYWYLTFMISSPILASYLALKNGLTLDWLMNFVLSVTLSMLLLDIVAFIAIELVGVCIGTCIFYLLGNQLHNVPHVNEIWLFCYMLFFTVIVGILFSRSREIASANRERQRLRSEVERRTSELADALAFKTEYIKDVSHEIRTPVHGFWNFSMILVDQWKILSDEKKFDIAVHISKNAERLKNIVSNLLDIYKHKASKWVMDPKKLDLSNVVTDLIEESTTLYIASAEKKIDIKFINNGLVELIADKELIYQVMRNLFANAVKFSHDNSTLYATLEILSLEEIRKDFSIELPIHFKDDFQFIHFSLKDEGVGIPEDEVSKIFDEFRQSSRTSQNSGGTGLGLAICKKIISLHGGIIFAENNKDSNGAIFHFILPKNYLQILETKEDKTENYDVVDLNDKVIVIIDDEERIIDTALLILEAEGYRVKSFTQGIEAIEYIRSQYYNIGVILLDLVMYEISGLDILTILMKDDRIKGIPTIIQSGIDDDNDLTKAKEVGVKHFLTKPYAKAEILETLKKVLHQDS